MSDLRRQVIKLAYKNPDLRPHLLPLLRSSADDEGDKMSRFTEGPEGEKEFRKWIKTQPKEFQDEWAENTDRYKNKFKKGRS